MSGAPIDVFGGGLPRLKYLRFEWDAQQRTLTVRMNVKPIQCYSLAVMAEYKKFFAYVDSFPGLVRNVVLVSDVAGVFNFGGDLSLFALLVRAKDLKSLKMYGHLCLDLVWWLETAPGRGIHTTALVQGDALGGGLESVLPFGHVIFERSAQAGFPEMLFNLFPGMGAWNFTARKAGFQVANEMVLSGKLFSADELHARGVVDQVVEDGEGPAAVSAFLRSLDGRHRGTIAALKARRRMAPVSEESLRGIVEDWAEAALQLEDRDLRLMERLARAQLKKVGGGADGAVEEIKRIELEAAWAEQGGAAPASAAMPLAA
ncbi:crotonase/enoyl-CoA hydratase family protein [Methylibium petroleiphilum]|uniref:Enoyl-CoA hydratase/carnithine racemase-like protein n=1 Tax=Methylibium petroleiphilum (strain ATCC BAA-1232 / LMG 22953 / PM1) TaxID=420662 RepID=A2SN82_METPP|nr:crotonase/enoyl-CoA hydratase family protein [Methylibium petroleiphilum]ABM97021.1 enoyl-CoA hydratase/carnithine racemase-like protein [Methylibium petroleiphilum PM1]